MRVCKFSGLETCCCQKQIKLKCLPSILPDKLALDFPFSLEKYSPQTHKKILSTLYDSSISNVSSCLDAEQYFNI